MKNLIFGFGFCFFILTAFSCNKTTTVGDGTDANILTEKAVNAMYPHEKDFFKSHGATFLANKEQCLGCHGKDGSGGTANTSCIQCHEVYPHANFLGINDQHATSYAKNPQSCSRCHGDDWSGGKSGVSCLKCHENFPHPKKFASPDQHGKAFVELKDKKQCLACHDAQKPEALATKCDTCHKAYPHSEKFMAGGKPHKAMAKSYDGKCLSCHQDYKNNMPNLQNPEDGVGCMNCHSGEIEIHFKETAEPQKPTGKISKKPDRIPTSSPHKVKKKTN